MLRIRWNGEQLSLLADRAVLWERRRTLLIADPHFGKAATFRHAGIPVPRGTTRTDLDRLSGLLRLTGARRLIILGDFFHARRGRSPELATAWMAWRERWPEAAILLVRGNHDLHAGDPPPEWGIEVVEEPFADSAFQFRHDPVPRPGGAVIGGHWHPAVLLEGPAGAALRAPCFWFGAQRAVLPAFGSLTGSKTIRPRPGDRIFVTGYGEVIEAAVAR